MREAYGGGRMLVLFPEGDRILVVETGLVYEFEAVELQGGRWQFKLIQTDSAGCSMTYHGEEALSVWHHLKSSAYKLEKR